MGREATVHGQITPSMESVTKNWSIHFVVSRKLRDLGMYKYYIEIVNTNMSMKDC